MNPTTTPTDAATTSPVPSGEAVSTESYENPHDRLTPAQRARLAAYLAEPKELPRSCLDENGRLLPLSAEEMGDRMDGLRKRLAEIDAMEGDDPSDTWERFAREVNQERRELGMRPVFKEDEIHGTDRRPGQ